MKKSKLKFTLFGLAVHVILMITWLFSGMQDTGLWAVWFGSFNALLGIYTAGRVTEKKNYANHQLEEKRVQNGGQI